ncbi:unnamed protein product, partial [marine sediment metagenome]
VLNNMDLIEYVRNHIERGSCQCGKCFDGIKNPESKQPKGHTADLTFFKVRKINNPDAEEFKKLVEKEFPHWLDGKEHSYLETGGDIGDQGLALMAMGLGELLGMWELLTPNNMVPFLNEEMRMKMAGRGFISIKAKLEVIKK